MSLKPKWARKMSIVIQTRQPKNQQDGYWLHHSETAYAVTVRNGMRYIDRSIYCCCRATFGRLLFNSGHFYDEVVVSLTFLAHVYAYCVVDSNWRQAYCASKCLWRTQLGMKVDSPTKNYQWDKYRHTTKDISANTLLFTHTHTHTHTHNQQRQCTHPSIHTHTHTRACARAHVRTHTYTHAGWGWRGEDGDQNRTLWLTADNSMWRCNDTAAFISNQSWA